MDLKIFCDKINYSNKDKVKCVLCNNTMKLNDCFIDYPI